MDAIRQDMKNVRIAFKNHDGDPNELIGYQDIELHLIFDIKMAENFRRKARLVTGGPPYEITCCNYLQFCCFKRFCTNLLTYCCPQ